MANIEKDITSATLKIISSVLLIPIDKLDLNDSIYSDHNCSSIDYLRILSEIESKLHVSLIKRSSDLPAPTAIELKSFKIKDLIGLVTNSVAHKK